MQKLFGEFKPTTAAEWKTQVIKDLKGGAFESLVWHKVHLRSGIYLFKGALTNFHLSQRFDLKYTDLNLLIASQR